MNWGIVEWSALIGIIFTIISAGLASYLGVVKSTISTKKDIDSGFKRLRDIETATQIKIEHLETRIDKKADRIQTLETVLYDYLKKTEAEATYCKKDTMKPVIDRLMDGQDDIKINLNKIVEGLDRHINADMEFQRNLLLDIKGSK